MFSILLFSGENMPENDENLLVSRLQDELPQGQGGSFRTVPEATSGFETDFRMDQVLWSRRQRSGESQQGHLCLPQTFSRRC